MGLDMYITARRADVPKETVEQLAAAFDARRFGFTVSEVILEVAYFRKFNALHNWFVQNLQGEDDCGEYYIPLDILKELHGTLKKVLAVCPDAKAASELLPTADGFFFGSTEYDRNYWDNVIDAEQIVRNMIEHPGAQKFEYYYRSSW